MSDNLKQLVEDLVKAVKGSIERFKKIKPEKWTFKTFIGALPELTALVKDIVTEVERISKQVKGVTGDDKKEAVMSILNALVDSGTIKIPFVPKWLVKKLLGLMVDWVVGYYNEKFGKGKGEETERDWIEEPSFNVLSVR